MSDVKVNIRAKKGGGTGITDEFASRLYNTKGSRYMAIVEIKVDETHEKADGDRKVDLIITEFEPVVADKLDIEQAAEDHIRTFHQALYRNRITNSGDQELPIDEHDGPAPRVADVLAAGKALIDGDESGNVIGLFADRAKDKLESEGSGDPEQDLAPGDDTALDEPDEDPMQQVRDDMVEATDDTDEPGQAAVDIPDPFAVDQ